MRGGLLSDVRQQSLKSQFGQLARQIKASAFDVSEPLDVVGSGLAVHLPDCCQVSELHLMHSYKEVLVKLFLQIDP